MNEDLNQTKLREKVRLEALRNKRDDAYRRMWEKQVRKDMLINSRVAGHPRLKETKTHINDLEPSKRPLTKSAKTINDYLNRNFKMSEISILMGKGTFEISQLKERYDLPRK
tara:strand:+ start:1473 stop:1808 length:336 start_codon:yes stop_codon:yes gene_type:complete